MKYSLEEIASMLGIELLPHEREWLKAANLAHEQKKRLRIDVWRRIKWQMLEEPDDASR